MPVTFGGLCTLGIPFYMNSGVLAAFLVTVTKYLTSIQKEKRFSLDQFEGTVFTVGKVW